VIKKKKIFGWFRDFRERLERRHIDGRNFDGYNSNFYHWIRTIFGYDVLLHVLYIRTRGIFYISLRLRDIMGGKFMGKIHFWIVLVANYFLLHSPLDRAIIWMRGSSRCYLDSKWWRSEENTPKKSCASYIIVLQCLGQFS
jgi:hypothetical protein